MEVVCWGKGGSGRLGHGAVSDSSLPVGVKGLSAAARLSSIVQVSSGESYTCALARGGTVACWGKGNYGQLGNNATADSNVPVSVIKAQSVTELLDNIAQISMGWDHSCALTRGSEVKCWGHNGDAGKLGNRSTSNTSYPVSVLAGETGSNLLTNIIQISSGWTHSCAVVSNGQAKCWGGGNRGQLGNDKQDNLRYPVDVMLGGVPLSDITELSTGESHTCAISAKNQVQCWGRGDTGELGNNANISGSSTPLTVVAGNESRELLAVGTFQQSYNCSVNTCSLGKIFITKGNAVINGAGNGVNLSLSISGILAGETVKIYSDNTCKTQVGGSATTNAHSVEINNLAEGMYQLYFNVSKGGSTSICSKNYFAYFADTTAPPAPTGINLAGATLSSVARPLLTVVGATIGDIVYLYKGSSCADR